VNCKVVAAAGVFLAAMLASPAADAATLTVRVGNIDPRGGDLHVALFTEATWSDNDAEPAASAVVPAVAPETVVIFRDVKPGVYGLKSFQDVNRNGEFDRNLFGLPLERYGFSRDARPFLSTPGFDKTRFTIADGASEITIHLQ